MDYSDAQDIKRLALATSVSLSALVGLLIKKGLIEEEEMLAEVKRLRAKIEETG